MPLKTSIFSILVSIVVLTLLLLISPSVHSQTLTLPWTIQRISQLDEVGTFPEIVADTAGNLHAVWLSHPGEDTNSPSTDLMYAYSSDGNRWSTPLSVLIDASYTPRAVIDRQGWLHLTLGIGQTLMYTRVHSTQAGNARNWLPPKPLTFVKFFGNQAFLLDSTGMLHVVYQNFDASTIEYIGSTDGGNTWSSPAVLAEEFGSDDRPALPDLIEDQQSTLHLVWSMTQAPAYYGGEGIHYTSSMDRGLTWTSSRRLDVYPDQRNDNAWLASIAETGSGNLVVVWDRHAETGLRMYTISNDGGLHWETPRPVPGRIILQTGLNPMLRDASGNLFLFNAGTGAGISDTDHHVLVNRWTGNGWGSMQDVAPAPGAHYIRGVVTHGNQLNLVWGSLSGYRGAIFHAYTFTDAPYEAGAPVPPPNNTATPTARPKLSSLPILPTPSPTKASLENQFPIQPAPTTDQQMAQTLLLSLTPALLIILTVVLVRLHRRI